MNFHRNEGGKGNMNFSAAFKYIQSSGRRGGKTTFKVAVGTLQSEGLIEEAGTIEAGIGYSHDIFSCGCFEITFVGKF